MTETERKTRALADGTWDGSAETWENDQHWDYTDPVDIGDPSQIIVYIVSRQGQPPIGVPVDAPPGAVLLCFAAAQVDGTLSIWEWCSTVTGALDRAEQMAGRVLAWTTDTGHDQLDHLRRHVLAVGTWRR